jgi:RNase P/RNase MRP subunit p29
MEERARVECYSGSRFAERPVCFHFLGRRHVVRVVEETWRSPSGLHFRVVTEENRRFELTYDDRADEWNITSLGPGTQEQQVRGER